MRIARRLWTSIANDIAGMSMLPRGVACAIYRRLGMRIDTQRIAPGLVLYGPHLSVGRDTFINRDVLIENDHAWVRIGRHCDIAMRVVITTASHRVGAAGRRAGEATQHDVIIGDGVWIGAAATILPGVTIGAGCVIGAGAVVISDCVPNGVYAGVPARRIRELD
jgi:maltose O-acetyltransferase